MFYRLISRLQIFGIILLVIALAADISEYYLFAETLYPVESVATTVESGTKPVLSNVKKNQSANANPFVPIVPRQPAIPTVSAPDRDAIFARQFDRRNIKLSAFHNDPKSVPAAELNHCKALVEQTLSALPSELIASLDDLTLYFSEREPRGMSNSRVAELRCGYLADTEIVSVLVHELGHVTDLGYLRGVGAASGFMDGSYEIPESDLSTEYYRISWINTRTKKFSSQREDFVSGYAGTDPFEDFAESFDFYVLHGADFRALVVESQVLQAKYDFLRERIFAGVEFGSERRLETDRLVWDVTLLDFELAEFFSGAGVQSAVASR